VGRSRPAGWPRGALCDLVQCLLAIRTLVLMIRIPANEWEALAALVANEVRFILVGGHAVVFYGGIRETADVDLLVDTAEPNPVRLYRAIHEVVGCKPAFDEADLRLPGKHIRFASPALLLMRSRRGPGSVSNRSGRAVSTPQLKSCRSR
jgi:hypothetical protein